MRKTTGREILALERGCGEGLRSLQVCAEEWRVVPLVPGGAWPDDADAACGLVPGNARFEGLAWGAMSLAQQFRARARIGRVFSWTAWVSNLTVRENLLLAGQYHGCCSESDLLTRAGVLGRRFGLGSIPDERWEELPRGVLRGWEWVRAWLLEPSLLLLECPELGVEEQQLARLCECVAETVRGGAAVVWWTDQPASLPAIRAAGGRGAEDRT